ncbi:MAG: glutathione S-transferase family protein [Pseudomonadota bacterium]
MGFILYSYPDCASHVVRMVLEELGATYRDEVVDMRAGAHRSAEFLRLNPRGLVPVLVDQASGATVSETGAILQYLVDQSGRLGPLSTNPQRRAAFLQRLYFLSNTLHADAQLQYYTERYVGEDLAEAVRPAVHARMRGHFAMLDAAIADHGGPWLLGAELSVCDFYLGGCARWPLLAPRHAPLELDAVNRNPHLSALLEKLEARPSVIRAFDADDTPRSAYFRAPVRSRRTAVPPTDPSPRP